MFGLMDRHRRETVAIFIGAVAAITIVVNALFLQPGQHPAPIWAHKMNLVSSAASTAALPRPRPVETRSTPHAAAMSIPPALLAPPAARSRAEIVSDIQRELARRGYYDGTVDGVWGGKTDTAMRDFAQAAGLKAPVEANEEMLRAIVKSNVKATVGRGSASEPSRNDPIAEAVAPSKRVVAVQRALADFGYGQIRPTGLFGPETQSAIESFERDRKLPVTGQISDRTTRELAAMTGRPLE